MKVVVISFIQYAARYKYEFDKIIQDFNNIKIQNKRLVIITEKKEGIDYIQNDQIKYYFYNTDIFFQNLLSKNIFTKKTRINLYVKFKRFLILTIAIIKLSEELNDEYIFYIENNLRVNENISENEIIKLFDRDSLMTYIDRTLLNYLDDSSLLILNSQHNIFKKYIKYLRENIERGNFAKETELLTEYLFTKIRHYFENLYLVSNKNLSKHLSKDIKTTDIYNIIKFTAYNKIFSKDLDLMNKQIINRNKKLIRYKNRKINLNFFFSNLELSGFFNEESKILNISDINNNLEITFPYCTFENATSDEYLKNMNNYDDKYDFFYFEYTVLKNIDFLKIILEKSKKKKKVILRQKYFLNKKNKFLFSAEDVVHNAKVQGINAQLHKKIKSDILILSNE